MLAILKSLGVADNPEEPRGSRYCKVDISRVREIAKTFYLRVSKRGDNDDLFLHACKHVWRSNHNVLLKTGRYLVAIVLKNLLVCID